MINLFISNSPAPNKIINSTGNKVTINLQTPIELATDKTYEARLLQASIIYCMPNITSKNNLFKYKYNNNVVHTYNIPVGLYTLDSLNKTIALLTLQQVGNESVFYFQADEATSQIMTYFTVIASSIDCSGSNNVMQLLGYENDIEIGNFSGTIDDNSYSRSTFRATLNPITSILVKCNICQGSSYVDSGLSNVMATIVPNCGPWSNIYVEHYHPQRCLVSVKYIYKLEVELVNQDDEILDFSSEGSESIPELWSISLSIEDVKRFDIL